MVLPAIVPRGFVSGTPGKETTKSPSGERYSRHSVGFAETVSARAKKSMVHSRMSFVAGKRPAPHRVIVRLVGPGSMRNPQRIPPLVFGVCAPVVCPGLSD